MSKAASARMAILLERITFFPRPAMNRGTPLRKSSQVSRLPWISRAMVSYRTMGPAMSWGKKDTYSPTSRTLRWAGERRR